jgi:hypothetical protein
MGCVTATAKRRRRQAVQGNTHVAKLGRRIYSKKSAEKSAAHLQRTIAAERIRQQRKAKGK